MRILPIGFRRLMRSLEQHLADQAEQREERAITNHIKAVNAQLGRSSGRREPMPYRLHIAIAFASLASALASLYAWLP